jgi:hypothetical protein
VRRSSPASSWPASPTTAVSLGPFAMWSAFPAYYGTSVPSSSHQQTVCLPAVVPGGPTGRGLDGGSHVHPLTGRRDRRPALPLQPRHGYAADLHHGLPSRLPKPAGSRPPQHGGRALLTGPDPPGSSRRTLLRGFHHWFLHSYTSPSCLPGPGGLAVPTRPVVLEAAPTRPRTSVAGLPPASTACCDRPRVGPFTPPGRAAPRGALRSSVRSKPCERRSTAVNRGHSEAAQNTDQKVGGSTPSERADQRPWSRPRGRL